MTGRATAVVREELVRVKAGRECDRRAELAGLLRAAGTFRMHGSGRYGIEAGSEHPVVARRLYEALAEALRARGEVRLLEPGRGHPRPRYVVRADDVSLQRLVESGLLADSGAPGAVPRRLVAKRCCAAAFLRGAFLARGSVGDPKRDRHFEIRTSDEHAAREIAGLLERIGAPARVREHRGWSAYLKGADAIGVALAAMGAHTAYLAWEEGGVWKSVHVQASRLANADAANARRLARASAAQLAAIDEVEAEHGLRALPAALREIAELRRAHPDASIEELGRLCAPPVSKGAAADRLRRIAALADARD